MLSLYLLLVIVIFVDASKGDGYSCPSGWTRYKNECFIAKSEQLSWEQASEYCYSQQAINSSLVEIYDAETNIAVKDLLKNTNMEYWINIIATGTTIRRYNNYGYQRPTNKIEIFWNNTNHQLVSSGGYHNFKRGAVVFTNYVAGKRCGFMDGTGYWFLTERCSSSKRFICSRELECEQGYYGETCELQCHCYKSGCNRITGVCPYGCERGWVNENCGKVKEPAKVAIYCFKLPEQEQYALIRIDPMGVKYGEMYLTGDSENSISHCNASNSNHADNGILNLKILINNNDTSVPVCSPKMVGNDVYQWTLRTEEIEGFHNYYDRTYQLKCDFKKAETLARNSQQNIDSTSDKAGEIKVVQTAEDVKLVIQDPVTSEKIFQTLIGSRIQLAMILDKHYNEVSAFGISPYNCTCSTLDGKISRYLTDHNGCSVKNSPVSSQTGSNFTVVSNVFDAFTINDNTDIVFSCKFEFCFEAGMLKCSNRCSYSHSRRYFKFKRSVTSQYRVDSASTSLHLIQHDDPKLLSGEDDKLVSSNSQDTYLNPLTYSLIGVVTVSLFAFVILFVRQNRNTVRS